MSDEEFTRESAHLDSLTPYTNRPESDKLSKARLAKMKRAVVRLEVLYNNKRSGVGSGCIMNKSGCIITAFHNLINYLQNAEQGVRVFAELENIGKYEVYPVLEVNSENSMQLVSDDVMILKPIDGIPFNGNFEFYPCGQSDAAPGLEFYGASYRNAIRVQEVFNGRIRSELKRFIDPEYLEKDENPFKFPSKILLSEYTTGPGASGAPIISFGPTVDEDRIKGVLVESFGGNGADMLVNFYSDALQKFPATTGQKEFIDSLKFYSRERKIYMGIKGIAAFYNEWSRQSL